MSRGKVAQTLPHFFVQFFLLTNFPKGGIIGLPRTVAAAGFLSIGSFNKNVGKILCTLPIVFYPEMGYYNSVKRERESTFGNSPQQKKLEKPLDNLSQTWYNDYTR